MSAPLCEPTTMSVADQSARWVRRGRSNDAGPGVGDPSLPLDPHDPSYVEVFGELDDTAPINVTRLTDRRRWRGGT